MANIVRMGLGKHNLMLIPIPIRINFYLLWTISKGGSDWISIKIKNTETGNDLPETLTKIKFSSTGWTHDNLGFFYAVVFKFFFF